MAGKATKCAQIQERMLDAASDSLSGSVRAAFEAHLSSCAACAEEVRHVLGRLEGLEFDFAGEKIRLHFSRGWTDYKSGETAQEFLQRADVALYENKRAGKRCPQPVHAAPVPQSAG